MKTITKRLIAALAAMTMLAPTAAWAAKGETDVDIAVDKPAISKAYGYGGYAGNNVTNVTKGGIFISCTDHNTTELVTIDLGARYPINAVNAYTYGNDTGTSSENPDNFGLGSDVVFDCYVTNTNPGQSTDISTTDGVKLNYVGDTKFVPQSEGGYKQTFELENVASYRYVQFKYIKGSDAKADLYMGRVNVWTTEEAAKNVPTVVSVGKPMWREDTTWTGMGASFDYIWKLNDGDVSTACGLYNWGDTAQSPKLYMDLEAKYPIEKITITKPSNGTVDAVKVSNDRGFSTSAPLTYDAANDEYYLSPQAAIRFGTEFRYVMVQVTNGKWYNDWYTNGLNEISVYSTSQAAKSGALDVTNIALGKSATSTAGAGAFPAGYNEDTKKARLGFLTDGSTANVYYNEGKDNNITIDLGAAYPVESIHTQKLSNVYGAARNGEISAVKLSNDPNFNEDSTVTLSGGRTYQTTDPDEFNVYYAFAQDKTAGSAEKYRYVRLYDNKDSAVAGWQIDEVEIYVSNKAASLKNASLKSTATFDGGAPESSNIANLIDGDSKTAFYGYNGKAVIALPYPMTIEQIEVDSRPGYDNLADNWINLSGYNIWVSNAPNTSDASAVQVSTAGTTNPAVRKYHAGATVVTEVDSNEKYSYVIVQCANNGEFFIYDVRVMSDEVVDGTKVNNSVEVDDATVKVSTSFVSDKDISKTVKLFAARFDNNVLTEVKMSDDVTLSGKSGSGSLEYTFEGEVTENTEFKGFVWEVGTMTPFKG